MQKSNPGSHRPTQAPGPGRVPPITWMIMLGTLVFACALLFIMQSLPPPQPPPEPQPDDAETNIDTSSVTQTNRVINRPAFSQSAAATYIAQLRDLSLSPRARRQAALTLAQIGSDEALAALRLALLDAPPYLQTAIAASLGDCEHPDARPLLLQFADSPVDAIALGAIQGLARMDNDETAGVLERLLFNNQKPEDIRAEAALALGDLTSTTALAALTRALTELTDEGVLDSVLTALGQRPLGQTVEAFRAYLGSERIPVERKVRVLEILADAEGNVGQFALDYASHPNPEIRAAAAAAIGFGETERDLSPELFALIKTEQNPAVRAELYTALANQEAPDRNLILALARNETDPVARFAVLELVATSVQSSPSRELNSYFNQSVVPELKDIALTASEVTSRLSAVISLSRGNTSESIAALREIAATSRDSKTATAAQRILGSGR